ncbi:MAG: ArnT family glycosyltransferase [Hyphomonas sp.]
MPDGAATPLKLYEGETLSWRAYLLVILVALAAMLPGFFTIPAMDRDESRYAQASRQMMETGDYIDIRFQDAPRHRQPVGTYWAQTVTATPFGGAEAPIWAHRLPGLIGILAALMMTAWLGTRLFSPQVGLTAALILACCLALQVEARTAKTDGLLFGFGMLAQTALAMLALKTTELRPRFIGWPLALWAGTGAALLIKGPIFLMVTALTLIAYAAWTRDWTLLRRIRPGLGVLVVLAIAAPWLVTITLVTNGAFLAEAVGWSMMRKVTEAAENHAGPIGFHLILSPITLWPASALIGLAILAAWRHRADVTVRFLVAWIVPTWLVFELVTTKLPHYTIPTFPAIALLMALGLRDSASLLSGWKPKTLFVLFTVLAGLVAIILAALPFLAASEFETATGPAAWIAAAAGLAALIAIITVAIKPALPRLGAAAGSAIVLYAAMFGLVIPSIDAMWPSERSARLVAQIEGCESLSITTLGYREPSNAFYLGTETLLADSAAAAAERFSADPVCGLLIADAAEREGLDTELAQRGIEVRSLGTVSGHNLVKGRELELAFLVHDASPLTLGR